MVKPTKQQLDWAQQEIGVLIHYDIQVFEPDYEFRKSWGYQPAPKVFNPKELNTDQWIETAKAAGAKYVILVAKHCSGFSLWPTKAHDYSVANSSYNGDIAGEFIASCKKYGVKPGFYYSLPCNARFNVDNGYERSGDPKKQKAYYDMVEMQLRELWGNYGELFEIWFDGGVLSVEKGGSDIKSIYEALQPNAIKFQGSTISDINNLRWVGNEDGVAPIDCYSTVTLDSQFDGTVADDKIGAGSIDGNRWSPAECDMPNRRWQWFYKKGQSRLVLSASTLVDRYYKSVGRNGNLLLGMVIDDRGLVPEKDRGVFVEFGKKIRAIFENPIATISSNSNEIILNTNGAKVKNIVIEEDIAKGHTVDGFELFGIKKGKTKLLFVAHVIGHKRIVKISPQNFNSIKLVITKNVQDISAITMTAF